ATLVAVLSLSAGCRAGPAALTLGEAPWQDGEVARYDILDGEGNRLGSATFSVAREGGGWVLSEADEAGAITQSSRVLVDATLRPVRGHKEIRAPGTEATVEYTYAGEDLKIEAVVNGEQRAATVKVSENILDNDQLLMTLRAMRFAEGYEATTLVVVPANALRISTTVRVRGKDVVEVPAGTFESWRVELDFGQARQQAWYQVGAPHRMLQYDNGAQRLVLMGD
ncbi:MAG: DUF3108 domain-containing protein, partial [Anaerolineae bacterium]|nr:DUF3108 domain-containing protein [Anaerolineae bacterium]